MRVSTREGWYFFKQKEKNHQMHSLVTAIYTETVLRQTIVTLNLQTDCFANLIYPEIVVRNEFATLNSYNS